MNEDIQKVYNYKDIFTDAHLKGLDKEMQDEEKIFESIKQNANKIIADADKYIKDNNLNIPYHQLSQEDIETQKELDTKLDEINQKLMELRE